jgi:hypothetical protein
MSMPPPVWSELWRDIVAYHPHIQWPVTDEVKTELVGKDWNEAGAAYLTAGEPQAVDQELATAWPDGAGEEYRKRVDAARGTARATGEEMRSLGHLATVFAKRVLMAKEQITDMIEYHEEFYLELTQSLWAWFNKEQALKEAEGYRMEVAGEIRDIFVKGVIAIERTAAGE